MQVVPAASQEVLQVYPKRCEPVNILKLSLIHLDSSPKNRYALSVDIFHVRNAAMPMRDACDSPIGTSGIVALTIREILCSDRPEKPEIHLVDNRVSRCVSALLSCACIIKQAKNFHLVPFSPSRL